MNWGGALGTQGHFQALSFGSLWSPAADGIAAKQDGTVPVSGTLGRPRGLYLFFLQCLIRWKMFAEDFFLCGQSENHLGAVGVNADPWAPPGPGELAAAEAGGGICICDTLPRNSEATLQSETHGSTGLGRVSQGAKWREC